MKITLGALGKKVTLITTAFVLALSSLMAVVPFIVSETAYAVGEVIVNPSSMGTWSEYTTTGGNVEFVVLSGSPLGVGAAKLTTTSDNNSRARLTTSQFSGTLLSSVTEATYRSYVESASNAAGSVSYSIQIDVDGDLTTTSDIVSLNHEPYWQDGLGNPEPVVQGVWQDWNVLDGKFWARNAGLGFMSDAGGPPLYSLSDILDIAPNSRVTDVSVYIGSYNPSYVTYVDDVSFNGFTFDFDPYVPTPTALPTKPTLNGEVIYDSISAVLPANYPSLGYAATSTSAFGDKITFGGTNRNLEDTAVTLSSWACENGQGWNTGNCVSTPGSTFSHDITLNIYNVADDGTVGSLLASRTQNFDIPYRPTADPTCTDTTRWRDANGICQTGYNHVVVFDTSGIVVPDTIIYSVAYDTSNYGTNPIGTAGAYDSLNVGLNTDASAPYVGTDTVPGELYWDSTYLGRSAGLATDSGWDTYRIAATFTADNVAPSVPTFTYSAVPSNTVKTSGSYTTEKDFKFNLSSDSDAVRYQLKYWNDIPGSSFKEASPWNPIDTSWSGHMTSLGIYEDWFTQGEGKHYFAFSACDAAGNCSAYSTPFVITYDKTIPDTVITGATVLGNTLSFEGSVSDIHLNYYYCYLTTNQTITVDGYTFTPGQEVRLNGNADSSRNGACNTTWAGGATSFTGVVGGFTIPGVPDGDYTINLVARDLAGNNNAGSPAQYVLTLDRTAPNVTVNPVADSTNTTPTITGTVDADAVSVKVSLDEGVTWNDAVIDGTTWTFAVTSPLAVRTHTVIAIATDAAGNTSSSDILTPQPYWTQFAVNEPPVVEEETTVQQGAGTPVPAPVVVAPQDTTPDAEIDTADDADSNVSAAGDSDSSNEVSTLSDQDNQKSWSLVNALLTAGIVLGSIMALVGAFGKKQDKDAKSKRVVGLITLVPAIGAAILFFAVEDLSAKMVWLNTWTILVTIIAVLQVALVAKARDNE